MSEASIGDIVRFSFYSGKYFLAEVTEVRAGYIRGTLHDRGNADNYQGKPIGWGPISLGHLGRFLTIEKKKETPVGIKIGDKVVGYGHSSRRKYVGTVEGPSLDVPGGWMLKDVDRSVSEGVSMSPTVVNVTPFKPEPVYDFVGPKPEPVKPPAVVLPLEADGVMFRDGNGNYLGSFSGDFTTSDQDADLAGLAVKLLNKHFGAE